MTSNSMAHFADATMEDLMDNPHRYGLPSFEEFARNPSRFRQALDQTWQVMDKGTNHLRKALRKQYYIVRGHRADTIEKAEQICRNEGIDFNDIAFYPEVISIGGGQLDIAIRIDSKAAASLSPGGLKKVSAAARDWYESVKAAAIKRGDQ